MLVPAKKVAYGEHGKEVFIVRLNEFQTLLKKHIPGVDFHAAEDMDPDGIEIERLVSDSAMSGPDTIFACVPGEHCDGHDYASKAVAMGACAVFCEHRIEGISVPQIICHDIRRNMGKAASILYGDPLAKLTMIAVTGTNGKTTSVFMVKSILKSAGVKTGLLGTVFCDDGNVLEDAQHTTPEGSDLQYWLHRMVNNGCRACVMEASSHAIDQGRIEGTLYDVAGFTNLTVDHLNYHKDMESYFRAKRKLFKHYMRNNWHGAVNIDDNYGLRLFNEFGCRVVGYSMKDEDAMFYAVSRGSAPEGTDVEIKTPFSDNADVLRLPFIGDHNIMNALQALSIAWLLGIDKQTAFDGLTKTERIPGRLESYMIGNGGVCVIDFAHNPDGLEKILTALRSVCKGKLSVAFGASGESDKTKRPLMGEVAARLADKIIITSDNPRSEDPNVIASEVEAGAKKYTADCKVIIDRESAIYEGLNDIAQGDILLLAGKGPERCQMLKDGPVPFQDRDVMLEWCRINGREVLQCGII